MKQLHKIHIYVSAFSNVSKLCFFLQNLEKMLTVCDRKLAYTVYSHSFVEIEDTRPMPIKHQTEDERK